MQNVANVEELKNKPIRNLIWQYALPAIIGTMVNALYNIIDRIFIGHWVGDEALAGLGLVLPIMNLTAAVGMLVGAGSASRISIYLGKRDIDSAEKIAGTSFLMTLVISGLTVLVLLLFIEPILIFAGASEVTLSYARDFLVIFLPGNIILSLCFNFNNMMRASGYPTKAMITMLISVIANIILAPIFIRFLGWGIRGAAAATILSIIISFIFVMHHFTNSKSFIKLRLRNIRLNLKRMWSIASIGLSPFCVQVASSIIIFFIISQLKVYTTGEGRTSDMEVGAFTIANTLIMLFVMIILGLTQGMQPIVGYNYGAKNYNRVKEALIYTLKIGVSITTFGFILGYFFPKVFVSMFGPGKILAEESAKALHIIVTCFPLVGFQVVVTSYFQCIGQAGKSIFLSLTRQFLFLVPALFILPHYIGLNGIWYSMPLADILAIIITTIFFLVQLKDLNKKQLIQNQLLERESIY